MTQEILVEITIEGKKSAITITPKGCEIEASLDLRKTRAITSIIDLAIDDKNLEKMYYEKLFPSGENERI